MPVYRPSLCLLGSRVADDVAIAVDSEGKIEAILRADEVEGVVVHLRDKLLAPGFVSAHSHTFQRALRGRTQRRGTRADDFWTWRVAMYELASSLDPDAVYDIAKMAFLDMLRSGVTAVGEFHYLHHDPSGAQHLIDEFSSHLPLRRGDQRQCP